MKPTNMEHYKPQKIGYFNDALVVNLVDFPIYYIECISERHFVIAGGGGSSKTGVHNQINILELVPTGDSCEAHLIMKFHTPDEIPDAIMTGSLMKNLPIVSGQLVTGGSNVTIYHMSFDLNKKSFKITDYEILENSSSKAELKCVKCLPGKIYSGALDGTLTVWNVSTNDKKVEKQIKAHGKEIDEIDIDMISKQIVTLSRDEGKCSIWDLTNLKLVHEFKRDYINNSESAVKYNYRSCRFAINPTSNSQSFLLAACNPIPNKSSSKLFRWSTSNYTTFASVPATNDGIMAMTVSSDGKLVAIGTRAGSVSVFEVRNLKQIYKIEGAHHNAVTNLEFLAPKPESLSLTNSKCCPLLSVSIDRRIVLHRPRKSSLVSSLFKLVIMVFLIYMIFFIFVSKG